MKFIGAHIFDYDATFRSNVNVTGNLDVDGTINIDAADIDGNLQLDGTLTVGVDDTGYDVKFYGDTASKYMLWDASADQLNIIGSVGIGTASPSKQLHVYGSGELGRFESTSATTTISLRHTAGYYSTIKSVNGKLSLNADDGNTGASTNINFNTDGSEKMRLTSGGNLLLATTTDSGERLQVDGNVKIEAANPYITLTDTTNPNYCEIKNIDGNLDLQADKGGDFGNSRIRFKLDGSEKMTLSNTGLGIGTTSPASKLDVRGTVQVGVDDTGHDVIFYGATSGKKMQWDESADSLIINGTLDVSNGELIPKSITMPHVSDPSDPADGRSIIWNDTSGNLKIKINVGGSVVTKTIATYE